MVPVIIPAYKKPEQLERCQSCLRNQTVSVEIFIKDNSEDNVYFTAAVNEGLRSCLGVECRYIVILNQDMYLEINAVEEMVKFMDLHPKCGIGAALQLDSSNPEYVIFGGGFEAFPFGKHQHGHLWEFMEDKQIPWANGACMVLRKQMIEEIGLLDENFVLIGSDSDYCFTARSRGWEVWRIAGARGIHERGVSGAVPDDDLDMLKVNDMLYYGRKWLTGDLYKGLAYEGGQYTSEEIGGIVSELEKVRDELVKARGAV